MPLGTGGGALTYYISWPGKRGVDIDQGGLIIAVVLLSNSQVTNGCPFQLAARRPSSEGVAVAEPCERSQARASLSEKMRDVT
jgi:hypothetical protein